MGWFSSACSFVGGAISSIGSAVASIGGALASSAGNFLKIASPYLGAVVQVIQMVATFLDVIKPEDKVDELGARAMQADKKSEDFESNAKYIEYLKNDIVLDTEKFEKAKDSEKVARTAIGMTIVAKGIEEKKGFDIPLNTWVNLAKLDLTDKANEIDKVLDTFKGEKIEDFNDYIEAKIELPSKEKEVGDTLVSMYKELEPNLSEAEIESKVMKMEIGESK